MKTQGEKRWATLAVSTAGLLLITLDNSILYTALPTLVRELGASQSQALWIINAYPLVMAGLLPGAGALGDRYGHRLMFQIGLGVFGLASLAAAFAPSPNLLIAGRALLAVGAAAMMPATLALLRVAFTEERERNFAMAVWGSLSIVGLALGPIVSGALLAWFWWGSVFLVNVPVVIVALGASVIVLPRVPPDPDRKWDAISSLLALVTLAALVFAIKTTAGPDRHAGMIAGMALVAIIAGVAFVRRQPRLAQPMLDFALFRNPAFLAGVLGAGVSMFAFAGLQLVMTQRFQLVAGFTPMQAGLLVSIAAIGSAPTMLLGGAFLHRVGLRILIGGGLGLAAIAVFAASFGASMSLAWTVAALAFTGAGVGAVMAVASTAIMTNAPTRSAGMAASVEEVSFELGGLLAVALLGSLAAALYSLAFIAPAGAPEAARESIMSALAIAEAGGAGAQALRAASFAAFDEAFRGVLLTIALVVACGAVATAFMLRRYGPGSQSGLYPH